MKIVLEQGPNCGKSTIIGGLAQLGYPVVNEKATEVICEGRKHPQLDHIEFQYEVLARQLRAERRQAHLSCPRFHDRGTYCGIVYRLVHGLSVPDFFDLLPANAYDLCLLPDPVPLWDADGLRYESPDFTREIRAVFVWVYERNGVPTLSVPFGTQEERLSYIFGKLRMPDPYDRKRVCQVFIPRRPVPQWRAPTFEEIRLAA